MNPQPLLVSTRDDHKKKRPPFFMFIRLGISLLALLSAGLFIFIAVLILNGDPTSCSAPSTTTSCLAPRPNNATASTNNREPSSSSSSMSNKCYPLPGADRILRGFMWCTPAQTALAIALLLTGDRRLRTGRTLAIATLAVTASSHVLFARFAVIVYVATSADPIGVLWAVASGFYFFAAALVTLVLSGALALVLLGGEDFE